MRVTLSRDSMLQCFSVILLKEVTQCMGPVHVWRFQFRRQTLLWLVFITLVVLGVPQTPVWLSVLKRNSLRFSSLHELFVPLAKSKSESSPPELIYWESYQQFKLF